MSQGDDKIVVVEELGSKGMGRREFIKRAAVGVGAMAVGMSVSGCGSDASSSTPSDISATLPSKTAWKFAVMSDSQWLDSDDGKNPNTSAIDIINQIQQQCIAQGVKFVVQVGDLADKASSAGAYTVPLASGGSYVMANGQVAEDTRALFAQTLYNAGIGFFPVRGNHDDSAATATEFLAAFPQTKTGTHNNSPANVLSVSNPDAANQPSPTKSGTSFTLGSNFSSIGSPSTNLTGLSYGFDYNNARFVFIDQFTPLDGKDPDGATYSSATTVAKQQTWISSTLAGKPSGGHAFVFAHKGLVTQQHQDILFGDCPADATATYTYTDATGATKTVTKKGALGMNDFIRSMDANGAKLYFCGHDHIHNRSIIKTTDSGTAGQVTHILTASNSSKFYGPNEYNAAGTNYPVPALTSNDAYYCGGKRQVQLSQELNTVGFYIVTVDGSVVTVDFYSAPVYPTPDTGNLGKESKITTTPTLNFTRRESFGYGQNGKQFVLGQGDSLTSVQDTSPSGTVAKILAGANNNPNADASGRKYYNSVNTGWLSAVKNTAGDILVLQGMSYTLGSSQTDVYVLSMSYDKSKSGALVLATYDGNGNWINAVEQNLGGVKKQIQGAWKSGYALGTYGIDTATNTVWAVLNYNGYFAVVAGV